MKPRLYTRQERAASIHRDMTQDKRPPLNAQWGAYREALRAMESPTPAAVDAAHNAAWGGTYSPTSISCDACSEYAERVVEVGDEPDYESRTAWLCEACLRAAVALVEAP